MEDRATKEQVDAQVAENSARFRAALPELIKEHRGEWVIFRDGQPAGFYPSAMDAYLTAVRRFGEDGGFAMHRVDLRELEPICIFAAS